MQINEISSNFIPQINTLPDKPVEEEPENDVAPAAATTEESGKGKEKEKLRGENGVLRLLQEGHFKPNADMRLREIFHRELTILGLVDEDLPPSAEFPQPEEPEL